MDLKGCKNKMYVEQLGEPVPEAAEAQLEGGVHDQHDHDHPPRLPSEQLVNRNQNMYLHKVTDGYILVLTNCNMSHFLKPGNFRSKFQSVLRFL